MIKAVNIGGACWLTGSDSYGEEFFVRRGAVESIVERKGRTVVNTNRSSVWLDDKYHKVLEVFSSSATETGERGVL
jgi:hypothetical protein